MNTSGIVCYIQPLHYAWTFIEFNKDGMAVWELQRIGSDGSPQGSTYKVAYLNRPSMKNNTDFGLLGVGSQASLIKQCLARETVAV